MQIQVIHQMVLIQFYSTELMLKNIEKRKQFKERNFSIFPWVHFQENATNVCNKVRIYPYRFTSLIKWFWFNYTVPNWCLKTLKNVKKIKQRNVFIFSWVHFRGNATIVFNKVPNLFLQIYFILQMILVELYITELMFRNIEKYNRIQTKKRFLFTVNALSWKRN